MFTKVTIITMSIIDETCSFLQWKFGNIGVKKRIGIWYSNVFLWIVKWNQIGELKKGLNPASVTKLVFVSPYMTTAVKTGIVVGIISLAVSTFQTLLLCRNACLICFSYTQSKMPNHHKKDKIQL